MQKHGAHRGGADPHPQPREDPTPEQVMPEGGCDATGSPRWSRFAGRACDPVGDPHWSSSRRAVSHGRDPTLGQFMESCLLWEGPHAGAGAEREEEGVAEPTRDGLTAAPTPRPPAPLRGRRWRNQE